MTWTHKPKLEQPETELLLSVAAILPRSLVNGPGVRSVLWVRGCPRRCPGCCNPEFQEFGDSDLRSPAEVAGLLLATSDIEGVTFSGGEPFAQAEALARVAAMAQSAGKGVVIFTGCTREGLFSGKDRHWRALLRHADMLIAGPYRKEMPSSHPLLASVNQEIVHLTERYRKQMPRNGKRVEFRFGVGGTTVTTGFPVRSPMPLT